ncbi:YARHG domain-containing protein [Mucilaginibacter sp. AW1-3]
MRFFKTSFLFIALAFLSNYQSHASKAANPADAFLGYWVGWFKPDKDIVGISTGEHDAWNFENKITISIDEITNGLVKGHSVVAGNYRPFTGKMINEHNTFHFLVKEPGDDKYDGVFDFYITEKNLLTGTWKANNKIRIPKRNFDLEKKVFHYNANEKLNESNQYVNWARNKKVPPNDPHYRSDYDISYFTTTRDLFKYNASAHELTKAQVANLKKADLFILRNSIYARHGYSFKNQQLRAYFDREMWYIPVSTDIKKDLTDVEKKNIELLMRYETNAKEYYDVFGRG